MSKWPTRVDPVYKNKSHYKEMLAAQRDELAERRRHRARDVGRQSARLPGGELQAPGPWYAVPADDKRNARLIIARIVVEALKALPLAFPKVAIPASRRLV